MARWECGLKWKIIQPENTNVFFKYKWKNIPNHAFVYLGQTQHKHTLTRFSTTYVYVYLWLFICLFYASAPSSSSMPYINISIHIYEYFQLFMSNEWFYRQSQIECVNCRQQAFYPLPHLTPTTPVRRLDNCDVIDDTSRVASPGFGLN